MDDGVHSSSVENLKSAAAVAGAGKIGNNFSSVVNTVCEKRNLFTKSDRPN